MKKALIVIDVQNEYFPGGKVPLWNPEKALDATLNLINSAKENDVSVIVVEHVVSPDVAPLFNKGTEGAKTHRKIRELVPNAPVIQKQHADAFHKTELESVLSQLGVEHIVLCGMMTHNCVTHTALSQKAEKYKISVVADACTTVSEFMHVLAVDSLLQRDLLTSGEIVAN